MICARLSGDNRFAFARFSAASGMFASLAIALTVPGLIPPISLATALRKESPAQLSAWGVDIKNIEAAGNFIAERISGSGGGLRSESLKAGGDVRLSDISGGG